MLYHVTTSREARRQTHRLRAQKPPSQRNRQHRRATGPTNSAADNKVLVQNTLPRLRSLPLDPSTFYAEIYRYTVDGEWAIVVSAEDDDSVVLIVNRNGRIAHHQYTPAGDPFRETRIDNLARFFERFLRA